MDFAFLLKQENTNMRYVVQFKDGQCVIRDGDNPNQVSQANDLGSLSTKITPVSEVKITAVWEKAQQLRCEIDA